jgi:hypothetical protein
MFTKNSKALENQTVNLAESVTQLEKTDLESLMDC